jgi:hypothetical protein
MKKKNNQEAEKLVDHKIFLNDNFINP